MTRGDSAALVDRVRWMAASNYAVEFGEDHALPERVLWPTAPDESHGMEDARFVLFTDGADVTYYATYTAFDGAQVAPHLLETRDFRTFTIFQLSGPSAANKGMALFPRKIAGRYAALSRWDRESNAIAYSDDAHHWPQASTFQSPARPWELIQLGNCGSPIETPAGWLVFTHGVGPMREYAIGAVLLDLEEPERLIAALARGYDQFAGCFGSELDFYCMAGWCSGYFKVSGMAVSMRSKACRWVLVGSASIGTVAVVPAKRTSLRVSVARCSSRPGKL